MTLPSLVFLVALDVAFITFIGGPAYKDALGVMMRPTPLVTPAVGAWAVIVLGVQTNTLPSSTKLLALQKASGAG